MSKAHYILDDFPKLRKYIEDKILIDKYITKRISKVQKPASNFIDIKNVLNEILIAKTGDIINISKENTLAFIFSGSSVIATLNKVDNISNFL